MSFAVANVVRQGVILVTVVELPPAVGVGSWFATALVVVVVVNAVAVAVRPQGHRAPTERAQPWAPLWPLRLARSSPSAVTRESSPPRPTRSRRWAPWWTYLVVILGANHLRRAGGVEGSTPATRVVLALAIAAALFVAITVLSRALTARGSRRTDDRAGPPARRDGPAAVRASELDGDAPRAAHLPAGPRHLGVIDEPELRDAP